ncbi:MAG: hypothetical protein QUT30_09545 [Acidobacteriota bacterium]|nr:hypothetical protein [Acidobacteriota bacterium]
MPKKLFIAVVFFALLPAVFAQPAPKVTCDRACLENYIDRYLDAMLAHKVSPDLFSRNCRFTENGVELPLGEEGLWYSMSGKGTYKFYIPDIETQQVAFIGTVKEGGAAPGAKTRPGAKPAAPTTVAVAIRLKIVNGLITEAEQLAIRPEQSLSGDAPASKFPPTGEAVEKMGAPHPIFKEVIPEAQRHSREELVRIGNYYFAGLQRNDGKGYYPFTDDAVRFENGMAACGLDRDGKLIPKACKKQFESGLEGIVTRIRDRRFVAVDRERGIVFAFGFFDHRQINWTWQLAELFKVEGENIRRIEAVFHRCPYGMNSGWSTYEQGMSEEIQSIR